MKDKFIKFVVFPHAMVFVLGLIVGYYPDTESQILDFLAIVLGICCIILVISVIYFIVCVYKNYAKNTVDNNEEEKPKKIVFDKDLFERKEKPKKEKKKFVFKTENDRLYEEAVKYFGKSYSKGINKYDLIEEYLKEDR